MLDIRFSQSPDGFRFERWHLHANGATVASAIGPNSTLAGGARIREGKAWKVVLLCTLRLKLGASAGDLLLGHEPHAMTLARSTASQLYKRDAVPWVVAFFGDGSNCSTSIARLIRFDNPQSENRFAGIHASSETYRVTPAEVSVWIGQYEAGFIELSGIERTLAEELQISPWQCRETVFVGREDELTLLEEQETSGNGLFQVVAPGGQGKTSLIRRWNGTRPIFFWPFYRQGVNGHHHLPLWPFRRALDEFLGLETNDGASRGEIVARWIEAITNRPCRIVLDGCEVMTARTTNVSGGRLAYPELEALIRDFPDIAGAGIVLTTRVPIEVPTRAIPTIHLQPMKPEWIAGIFDAYGIHLSGSLRRKAIEMAEGSPLLAHLLSTLAGREADPVLGMLSVLNILTNDRRNAVRLHSSDAGAHSGILARAFSRHETMLAGTPELALLSFCSAFQRDPDPEALKILLDSLPELRMGLPPVSRERWLLAADKLNQLKLAQGEGLNLTLHPLVQNYFSNSLREQKPKLWSDINRILYDHYKDSVLEFQPRDMPSLLRLLDAVVHGCQMGDPLLAYNEVAYERFAHRYEIYPLCHLGAVHEMVAGMNAIEAATRQIKATSDPKWFCGFANVNAISQIAAGNYSGALAQLDRCINLGYTAAQKSNDAEFVGVVLFALVHKLRVFGWIGNLRSNGLGTLRRLRLLAKAKNGILDKQAETDSDLRLGEAQDYSVAHICEFLLGKGLQHIATQELEATVAKARERTSREVTLLPGLAARAHGEYLAATKPSSILLEAVERGEAAYDARRHEFGNTESYLHGLALLTSAFQTTHAKQRSRLARVAKHKLDEAVTIASDRAQFHFEAPARLVRAEWAIGSGDEGQALEDIRSVQSRAAVLGWLPHQIRAELLMARLHLRTGDSALAEQLRRSARRRSYLCGFHHPWAKAHFGRLGPKHLKDLAAIDLE
ncbi:hypothetical protein KBB96_05155 [Luteolibacter ambystomatis]|uniref:Uncharacterized protein n=1 Tax=Luteolibacter ambystomatis TaxID=2824561 RepID=A0A975J1G8_9BACT|nr:hypothetical protein [Luteolibacter ambystomatis]QUE52281.1 hypothetical protein KBB96_05155 [Luteolibacter ambystomatis]